MHGLRRTLGGARSNVLQRRDATTQTPLRPTLVSLGSTWLVGAASSTTVQRRHMLTEENELAEDAKSNEGAKVQVSKPVSTPSTVDITKSMMTMGMRTIIVAVMGGFLIMMQRATRSTQRQMNSMRQRARERSDFRTAQLWCPRPRDQAKLASFLRAPPAAPLLIVGPHGCGRKSLVSRVLNERKSVRMIDLRADSVESGEALVSLIAREMGYIFPQIDSLLNAFTRQEEKPGLSMQEIDNAFDIIEAVCKEERDLGHPNGVPVLVLSDCEVLSSIPPNDPHLRKFLDWTLHITHVGLSHVWLIDVSRKRFDSVSTGFRVNRELFVFDFVPSATSRLFLQSRVNEQLEESGFKRLTDEEVDVIEKTIGGNLGDMTRVYTGVLRGGSALDVTLHLLSDAVTHVERCIESILAPNGVQLAEDKKIAAYGRYLRFWRLMGMVARDGSVTRRRVVRVVFKENALELEDYVRDELLYYTVQETVIVPSGEAFEHDLVNVASDFQHGEEVLFVRTESVFVSAASPRIRAAFQLLRRDRALVAQTVQIENALEVARLREREELLKKQRDDVAKLKKLALDEVDGLFKHASLYVERFGEEVLRNKLALAQENEATLSEELANTTRELARIDERVRQLV